LGLSPVLRREGAEEQATAKAAVGSPGLSGTRDCLGIAGGGVGQVACSLRLP